jgi:hypothetical protein
MGSSDIFKRCAKCGAQWRSRDDFIVDPSLELNGYKADFERLEYGLFFFTHKAGDCFSTMALETGAFFDMYKGKKYAEIKAGSVECPGYCRDRKELRRCDAMCEGAVVREIIQIISEKKRK